MVLRLAAPLTVLVATGCIAGESCTEEDARFTGSALCSARPETPTGLLDFARAVRDRGGVVVQGMVVDSPTPAAPAVLRVTERLGYLLAESREAAPVLIEDPLGEGFEDDARIEVSARVGRFFTADVEGTPACDAPQTWIPAGRDPSSCPYDPGHFLPRSNERYVFFLDRTAEAPYELAWGTHVFEVSRVSGDGTLDGVSVYLEDLVR